MTVLSALPPGRQDRARAPRKEFRDYVVCGGILRSALEFPELPATDADDADWLFEVRSHEPPALVGADRLGEREIGPERYRLHAHRDGLRLEYSHAGSFDVSHDGRRLCWYRIADASEELARAIVLGPALALALELRGFLCVHGSAVAIDGRAVAFLGGKYHGKSTLATAMTAAGASLISDDMLVIAPGSPPRLRPGVASVRLWQDSASQLDLGSLCDRILPGVKTTAVGFSGRALGDGDSVLSAIYLLDPVVDDVERRACWRTRVEGAFAAIALAHQTKLPPNLVGATRAGVQLRRAAATAATVPVWKLSIVRDFAGLPGATRQILEWHATFADPS